MPKIFCEKCNKEMEDTQFYTYKDGRKTELCKKCLTMHINAFDETTFLWVLEKMDLPYVPAEWNVLRDKDYQKKGELKFDSSAVFGKYLSKMKLKQWKDYGWEDGPKLIAMAEEQMAERAAMNAEKDAFYREKFEKGEISEAEFKTLTSTPAQREAAMAGPSVNPYLGPNNPFNENNFFREEDLPNPAEGLTEEDKVYLAMKWGRLYKPDEWLELEKTYEQMMASFDIQDADSINTLLLICKTNLKMNQAIDNGDIEGFQKLSKVSEGLRKSAKFTAAQNKEGKSDYVDSIGELVRICEKDGFIPRFATDIPQDKVDITLQDMQGYLYKLVTQDLGFGQQIEDSLKKIMIQKEMNDAADQDVDLELEDEDFEAFIEEAERQKDQDAETMAGEWEEE
jgi:hypothetical protein